MNAATWLSFLKSRKGILLALLLALVPVAAVTWFRRPQAVVLPLRHDDAVCEYFIERGTDWARNGEYETAMRDLHTAIRLASTRRWRAKASLRMGMILAKRARTKSEPYALMAQQYLLAAMNAVQRDDSIHQEALRVFIEVAALSGDRVLFEHVAQRLIDSAIRPVDKEAIYLQWIKNRIATSTYLQTKQLMDEAGRRLPDRAAGSAFGFLNVAIARELLRNEAWFEEYRKKDLDRAPGEFRTEIAGEAVAWLEKQAEENSGMQSECFFQLAAIHYSLGNWGEAKANLRLFRQADPNRHEDATILIMAGLARQDGMLDDADQAMRTFVRRHQITAEAEKEILTIVDLLEANGNLKSAYELLKESAGSVWMGARNHAALSRVVRMAGRLGLDAEAWQYYKMLVSSRAPAGLLKDLLLAEADQCAALGNLPGARTWLQEFLRIPGSYVSRADGLYRMFRVQRNENAPVGETMITGTAASQINPTHPYTVETILNMAASLEDIGLYRAAVDHFNSITLLERVGLGTNSQALLDMVGKANMGAARCLLKSGDRAKANHRFRSICSGARSGAVKSEAAYWWATMAVDEGQGREALRRLGLTNTNSLTAPLIGRMEIEKRIAGILTGEDWKDAADFVFRRATELAPEDQRDCLRRVCVILFNKLEKAGNVEGMQRVLELAAGSSIGKGPFFREMVMRLSTVTIRDRSAAALAEFMKPYFSGPENEIRSVSKDEPVLQDIYRQFQEVRPEAERCM